KLQAQIFVDGRMVGVSPVQVCLEPGEHEVEAVAPGMHSPPVQIVATRGHTERVVFSPVILNPDNRVVVDELERSMGQTPTDLDAPPRKRSGSVAGPLFPRGSVRLTDLRRFAIEFDDPVNVPEGEIRFLRGDEVLGVAVAPVSLGAGYGPLPDALVRALRPGDKVRWGFWAATGESPHGTAEFEVVDDPVVDFETRLAAVGAGQPPAALAHLRCDELLRQGLFTAAYEEAVRVTMSRPQSARAWRVRIEALDRMGADLSRLRAEELVSWDALPDEERERAMSHGRGSPR
ncbi:MAG: hypothetical protein MUE73_03500, partial [Planctomycetes bacterium]|nr:hypothetical protein [Planctomycetota bacterium]